MEEHSAYSTHYCSQEQESEEDEDHAMTLAELGESLQVGSPLPISMQLCASCRGLALISSRFSVFPQSAQACHQRLESEVSALQAMVRKDEQAQRKSSYPLILRCLTA